MKIVTGLYNPDDVISAVRWLTNNDINYDDISVLSSASDTPFFLEGEPEESAVTGAVIGALIGGLIGAVAIWLTFIAINEPLNLLIGLVGTTAGVMLGTYLGSIYRTRATTRPRLHVHDALADGKILLMVKAEGETLNTAVATMKANRAIEVEVHDVSYEQAAEDAHMSQVRSAEREAHSIL